ncbi:MAG: AmmeMemoRadiSam system radical SAM enzyme, partial [Sedimenticola sp.]|nr:AmmeMemoRadiSam system radical SAM enzyme [Sedimenticola sp.]
DWYELGVWHLTAEGHCDQCGEPCAGHFAAEPGDWGAKRQPVSMR